jgi:N-acetylglucosaminyldiphosphoundecaprenol N-acetyl-beta-D-mannosaminyltransferase
MKNAVSERKVSENFDSIYLSGMRIDMVQIPQVVRIMQQWIEENKHGNYIVVSNAYDTIMNCKKEELLRAANNSSLTVPDGFSLVLFGRMRGYALQKRVYGPDLTLAFLEEAQDKGYSNFFYGSTEGTLQVLKKNLKKRFPGINIAGSYSPPFRELSIEEEKNIADDINRLRPDVIWVGLGTPKQQLWMQRFKGVLNVPVMVGVGAAFDFLSGTKQQAPRFIRDNGFEWLFRLLSEPKRLWKRYLIGNVEFVGLVVLDIIKKNLLKRK